MSDTNTTETPRYVAVTMTPELYDAMKQAAEAANQPVGTWAKQVLADKVGVDVNATATKRNKYATEEERKAAQAAARKAHQALVKELLAQHKAAQKAAAAANS